MFLRPVRWASQQLPHGLSGLSGRRELCDLQLPRFSARGRKPHLAESAWEPKRPDRNFPRFGFGMFRGPFRGPFRILWKWPEGTPLCVGKPRNGVWPLRFSVKIRWDVLVWRLSFFFNKNRSSSSRRPERHANTKEVDISTGRVRRGARTYCDELRVLSFVKLKCSKALSEQKGAEKSSSPESCQQVQTGHDPWAFF